MQNPPPGVQLFQMMTGFVVSSAIFAAAKLGIADRLARGPRDVAELAREAGVDAEALYRLLRALASVGVFAETQPRTFTLTPMAEPLRSDHPASQHATALMLGEECYGPLGDLAWPVQTGRPAFDKAFGAPLFDYLARHPDRGRIFDQAMTGIHGPETRPMIDACDFSRFDTLIDIGGGNGSTLVEVLRACPGTRGVVFDLPQVAERTRRLLAESPLADRCRAEGGSFFESVPAASANDAYVLRHIIHDWDDDRSIQILRNCRRAAAPGAKVLIVESVLPPGNEPHPGKWLDIIMLAIPGGRERTAEQYERLLTAAGLRLARIVPTASPVSVIESTVEAA